MALLSNLSNYYLYALPHILHKTYHRLFRMKIITSSLKYIPQITTPQPLDHQTVTKEIKIYQFLKETTSLTHRYLADLPRLD